MAAPIVAGEAALLRAAFPNIENRKLIDHIERQTIRIQGPNPNKRIDIGAALTHSPGH
jgi:subtilisin family serine protease